MLKYKRELAVEYARRYALNYNKKYFHFDGIGGDCTNFVSQCLFAGGAKMNYDKYYGWYYISESNRSPSWSSVKYLERFLLKENTPGFIAKVVPISELEVGDVIQLRQNQTEFNHSLIVTKITQNEIYVCAHSYDCLDKPLSEFFYLELKAIHIIGIVS